MKTINKIFTLITGASVFALTLISCGKKEETKTEEPKYHTITIDEEYEEEEVSFANSEYINPNDVELKEYDIHTKEQLAYLNSGINSINRFASGNKELSKARSFNLLTEEEPKEYDYYYIQLSEDESFSKPILYNAEANNIDVTNLKINTKYYYRGANEYKDLKNAEVFSFTTENSKLRNCNVDGITNVRDIGGYTSKLGGYVRQGLYYRGGRLNVSETNTLSIQVTDEGYRQLIEELNINSEIDLRMNDTHYSGRYSNEFGQIDNDTFENIEYLSHPLDWTVSNMMVSEKERVGNIFKDLAKEENYPVYLHCNIGTDRTGMCTYLLGTLLGIPQDDLFHDYLFSNFANINNTRDISKISNIYYKTLTSYEKDNLYLDVRAYLNDAGVSDEELDNILNIFLELRVYD